MKTHHFKLLAVPALLAQLFSAPSMAQERSSDMVLDAVNISGQRASMSKALAAQHAANNIVSAVSADDIGGLPDKNVAEALARVPGISVQRDQGEGRYVTVRGLAPELNSVTVNGALVPSPEMGTRAVSLDVIPSGLVRSIEVQKTLTPDRDANSLGGTVDIKTLTAFDLPQSVLGANVAASYDENSRKTNPNAGLLWAQRFMDGQFGVALGLSMENRKFGSDDVETGGAWSNNKLSGWSLRDYHPERERNAFGLNLDFRPSAEAGYFLHTLVSRFSDNETRDSMVISNISGGSEAEGESKTARVERRLRDRKYTREIRSIDLGGNWTTADWKVEASGGVGRASEDTPEQLNEAVFRYDNVPNIGFTNTETPILFGPASLTDPTKYAINKVGFQQRTSRDTEQHAKADVTRKLEFGDVTTDLKFGVKTSRREKSNDTNAWTVSTSGLSNMSAYTGAAAEFPWGAIGPSLDPNAIRAAVAGRSQVVDVAKSSSSDWTMQENINAAYVMASTDIGHWNVLVGGRNEQTDFSANGYQVTTASVVTPKNSSTSYSNWLPSLQARYDLSNATSLRGAWTNSVVRANFSQLAPGVTYASATEVTIGNPDLLPMKSSNIDLGIEHMLGRDGSVSAYVFSKDIKNFTYSTNLAGTGAWAGYTTATGYANGDQARVSGIELAYYQALKFLPEPFNGLLIGANATYTSSNATIARYDTASKGMLSRDINMPAQSARVFNVMLGYEKGPVSTRIAVNSKSPYLLSVGSDILNAALDQIVDTQTQVDFSFKYQLAKSTQLVFEVNNLTNEKYYVYQGVKSLNVQNELYGRTYKFGLNFTL